MVEHTQQTLEAVKTAASRGANCTEVMILATACGKITMLVDSGWPLELAHRCEARAAYRVSGRLGLVRVEGE